MTEETNKAKDTTIIKIEQVTGFGGLFLFIFVVWWLAGIVLAKGFWSCLFAITMPPYAMYLLVERVMQLFGVT
ncbi:hypothetical protein D9M68_19160 [compost metagenome]